MTFCGINELGAAVDIGLAKASTIDIQEVLDDLYAISVPGVTVHEVGAHFGSDSDITAYIKTSLDSRDGTNPTWRLAKWVEAAFNHKNVVNTTTRIIIHDPKHEARGHART